MTPACTLIITLLPGGSIADFAALTDTMAELDCAALMTVLTAVADDRAERAQRVAA